MNGRVTTAAVTADVTQLTSDREARDSYMTRQRARQRQVPHRAVHADRADRALPAKTAKGRRSIPRDPGRCCCTASPRPVTFNLQARWDGPTIDMVGTAPITLHDYGITPPHTVIADVDANGSMEIDLTFVPGAG